MHDFDFLVGTWNIHNRRLTKRLAGSDEWEEFASVAECLPMFDGAGNVDRVSFPTKGLQGMSLRLFDPAREEWSIYWASSLDGILQPPVMGAFRDGVGTFAGDDTFDGQSIRVRFTWSHITPTTARWEQAFSADGELTWETNWIMEHTRA